MNNIGTGYYADPNRQMEERTKVHLIMKGKPICGSQIADRKVYQWCSPTIHLDYVECDKCKDIVEPLMETYNKILKGNIKRKEPTKGELIKIAEELSDWVALFENANNRPVILTEKTKRFHNKNRKAKLGDD